MKLIRLTKCYPSPIFSSLASTQCHTRLSRPYPRCSFPVSQGGHLRQFSDHRHPTAPKQHPDYKQIRQNVEVYSKNCVHRKYGSQIHTPAGIARCADELKQLASDKAELCKKIKPIQSLIARISKTLDGSHETSEELVVAKAEASKLADALSANNLRTQDIERRSLELALSLPNLTSSETPLDGEPKPVSYYNHDPDANVSYPRYQSHVDIGAALSILDFTSANTTSGWGFYYLLNDGVLLEQALIQHALSTAVAQGWTLVSPPSLVYSHISDACGFQPRDQNDEQQTWHIAAPERERDRESKKPQRSLTATAEIPLAAMYAGRNIPESELPLKFIGTSRCYRAEAGARGVDSKGLYRVHEFTKVEMFAWTDVDHPSSPSDSEPLLQPSSSQTLFSEMLSLQTSILASLNLPLRVLEMPASDMGASAYRKIDIETLFPSRLAQGRDGGWGEVTSLSLCTDYQSRRLGTRIVRKDGRRKDFPYTLNGTALAVPRVLAAVLEHGWREEEGCVVVPEVLRGFMGGKERIGPVGRR